MRFMRYLISPPILLLFAAWSPTGRCDDLPPVPHIQFAATTNDFGRVVAGSLLRHDFIFTNTGRATLHITNVLAACGCTTVGVWTRAVPPGGTGFIPLAYQTANLELLTVKEATVFSDDPAQPSVRLELRAQLWRPILVEPDFVSFHVTNDNYAVPPQLVRIRNQEVAPLALGAPVGDNPFFAAEVITNAPGRDYTLRFRLVPPLGISPLAGHFTLRTSSTNAPELRLTTYVMRLYPAEQKN